ncbi:hypothetical protein [Glaciihabitans sp. UYNi722]|uniref:hypothetical protein n=1 Tax=Glaciihabitans sp. UYNi722 TaxID=3156344 RepID=UPI0033915EE5
MVVVEIHEPVSHARFLLGALAGAGFVVAGIFLLAVSPAHADEGDTATGAVSSFLSEVTHPVSNLLDSTRDAVSGLTQGVTAAVPQPVVAAVQPVATPVTRAVCPVVASVPTQPVARLLQPVTSLVDPIVSSIPVVSDLLGANATQTLTDPVADLVDNAMRSITSELVTELPGADAPAGPSLGATEPTILPQATADVFVDQASVAVASPSSIRNFDTVSSDSSALTRPFRPNTPHAPDGQPAVAPAPAGSGSSAPSGGALGAVASDAQHASLFLHAAMALRALDSDDALPSSPIFDLGSTRD